MTAPLAHYPTHQQLTVQPKALFSEQLNLMKKMEALYRQYFLH
jgi:hypothetical protein